MQKINTDEEIDLFIHYGSAASEAMFDYPCHFFQIPTCIGTIAYRIELECAIIFGDPLCPSNELVELTQAFHKNCHDLHLNVIYIAVSEQFAKIAQEYNHISIEICEELIFDPQVNPLLKSRRLQHRMDKAIKHGLTFHEYSPINLDSAVQDAKGMQDFESESLLMGVEHSQKVKATPKSDCGSKDCVDLASSTAKSRFNQEIENSLLEIGIQWQKANKRRSFHLGHLNFFDNYKGKRWFYTKDGEVMTSMAMLSQLDAQEGWLLKFFFTLPDAFPETSEFLMTSLLTTLKNENCHFLTKGMVPIDSIGEVKGLGYSSKLIKYIYKSINYFFNFNQRKQYWQRYHPKKVPSYLLFSDPNIGFNEIRALFKVLRVD